MPIKTIACCVDFSKNANTAFEAALEMAQKYGAKLYLLHVVPPVINPVLADAPPVYTDEDQRSLIPRIEGRMADEYGERIPDEVAHELIVMDGHVSSEILAFLEERKVDVAVLGAYGLTGMGLVFFGSIAKRIAHKAPCSVMIVRSPGIPST